MLAYTGYLFMSFILLLNNYVLDATGISRKVRHVCSYSYITCRKVYYAYYSDIIAVYCMLTRC